MGDRCYMTVRCRVRDAAPFLELGFLEVGRTGNLIELEDEEANYAHASEMPDDVVYAAYNSAGDEYDAADAYCDGADYHEWPKASACDCFAFGAVDDNGYLHEDSRIEWAAFRRLAKKVEALLAAAKAEPETEVMPEDPS